MVESKINWSLVKMQEISDIQQMFSLISEKSLNIISSISADGVFTYISPNVKTLLGFTPEEVIGKSAAFFNHPDTNKKFQEHRDSLFIDQDTVRFTGRVRHKNGEYRWYETTAQYIRNESGDIVQTIGVGQDITERKEAEETIAYLAYHDSVTNLPNRRLFKRRLSLLLEESKNDSHGLMLIDLDGFKQVNDTFGHDIGDQLLTEAANRLKFAVGDKGFVARWGGDEFTVLQTNIKSRSDFTNLVERIKDVISEPFIIAGNTIFITASIGVAFSLEDGDTVEALINNADAEMYRAKNLAKVMRSSQIEQ
jgi:diguanylate cyclase (GGDEF)-like protein/PAS domain S-box-containing protein